MGKAQSLASLKPRLIACKGSARPAMRAGNSSDFATLAASQEDLGWNDMGEEPVATVHPFASFPAGQQATDGERRAAFTLRLDADRHLKLRLASAMGKCSSQQLVTEALDRLFNDIPQLERLVEQASHTAPKP